MGTQSVRSISKRRVAREPEIAAVYKLLKFVDDNFFNDDINDNWEALGSVRYMLGQKPMQKDGANYHQMREFIREFAERHEI